MFHYSYLCYLWCTSGTVCGSDCILYGMCIYPDTGAHVCNVSSCSVFRDLTQIISIVLQVGVWFTPIMWNIDNPAFNIPGVIRKILMLNPMYYIVGGYRDSLVNKVWFWQRPTLTLYFWCFTGLTFAFGVFIFKRLKVHFADVL